MKAHQIMEKLYSKSKVGGDGLVYGDKNLEIKKIVITCNATVEVIKNALKSEIDLLITHEPTFLNVENDMVADRKQKLLEEANMVIYRYHDGMHFANPDMIAMGELHSLGFVGEFIPGDSFAVNSFHLKEPMAVKQISKTIEEKLGISHVRICGSIDNECRNIALCFGAVGDEKVLEQINNPDIDVVIAGEVTEWSVVEYVRDCGFLGLNKTLIVVGHMGSEKDGMRLLAEQLDKEYSDILVSYFDCGESYTYLN